jgi:hypothetical protein
MNTWVTPLPSIPSDDDVCSVGNLKVLCICSYYVICSFDFELYQGFIPFEALSSALVFAKQWIFDLIAREGPLLSTVMAITCYHIWEAHNDARNDHSDPLQIRVL